MKKYMKIILPIAIIAITIFAITIIFNNPPQAKRVKSKKIQSITIETKKITQKDFTILINSYGLSKASVQTNLLSQVSGKVTYVNQNFINGAYFKKGDVLIEIEDIEYKADVKIAQADKIIAQGNLLEEKAQGNIAKQNWEKFNPGMKANSLVLRKPQLLAAQANVIAAQAKLLKTKLILKRTKILAPYDGRILQTDVNISDVISNNAQIASIYSTKQIEVRLPISNKDLKLIDSIFSSKKQHSLILQSQNTNKKYKAKIITSESSIDSSTKQFYLIARIVGEPKHLILSEYLKAKIQGNTIKNAILIPNQSIYQGSYVYIEKDSFVYRKNIEILWQDDEQSLISEGLNKNDNLVLTTLGLISSGTKVKVFNKKNNRKLNK